MNNEIIEGKYKIGKTRLEISKEPMETGRAYLFMRGDSSFMIWNNREFVDDHWFRQDWFDLYYDRVRAENQLHCSLYPASMSCEPEMDYSELITGTYPINNELFHLLENTIYSAYNAIVPFIEELEWNAVHYDYNQRQDATKKDTFVTSNTIPLDLKPGTCIFEKYTKNNVMHLYKIKNRQMGLSDSDNSTIRYYNAENFYFTNKVDMSHYIEGKYLACSDKYIKDLLGEKEDYKRNAYIVPADVFDKFTRAYNNGMNNIQSLRAAVVNTVLKQHKEQYGEESYLKAEKEVHRWLSERV